MAWMKDKKFDRVATDAADAWNEGLPFFTPILMPPTGQGGMSGRIADIEQMMAIIIGVGWQLHTWAVGSGGGASGRLSAMPLFVRPGPGA